MKKIVFLIISLFILIPGVKANSINSIQMNIYLDSSGNAHIIEEWKTDTSINAEIYRQYENSSEIGNINVYNLSVVDENTSYEVISNWDINASFEEKKYKAGLNYTDEGVEICFGISEYGFNTYTIEYDMDNLVVNTTDNQMFFWQLIPPSDMYDDTDVYIKIYSDFDFSDELPVWGYGKYGAFTYVADGYIEMIAKDEYIDGQEFTSLSSGEYMTLLVDFPSNTFNPSITLDNDFNYYYEKAEVGATEYSESSSIFNLIPYLFWFFIIASSIFGIGAKANKEYKVISKEDRLPNNSEINYFREIPCNKDIFRAYFISKRYNLLKKKTDFLGSMLLKWLLEKKVEVVKGESKVLKKETTSIKFFENDLFDNEQEKKLYSYMKEASKDNILEKNEFEKWCKTNYNKIYKWFDKAYSFEGKELISDNQIVKEKVKKFGIPFNTYKYDSTIREDAIKLKGLQKYFKDFSSLNDKTALEVNMWEYYLMYAQMFGMAKKVAKEFKKLYPDVITDNYYNDILFINAIAYTGMASASQAYSKAQSYNSGGGGFSSGGGGGGSFGGGGIGSR